MKTKTKRQLKHLHHTATHKKLVRKRTAHQVSRSLFATVMLVSFGVLTMAIAQTQPNLQVDLETNLGPRSLSKDPVYTGPDQVGTASWYALGLPAPDAHTCASTKFRRGTYLSVKNLRNGKIVVCRVNDYGPEAWTKRVIDLSRGSFRAIEDLSRGTTPVEIRVVPSPPSVSIPLPNNFSAFSGYRLCRTKRDPKYCEDNRQQEDLLQ